MTKQTFKLRKLFLRLFGRVKRHRAFVSLGYNCEVSYRYWERNGFCESGLLQWTGFASIDALIAGLKNLDCMFAGGISEPHPWYHCANTGAYTHGRIDDHEWANGVTDENRALMEEDREDVRGRMAYLRPKFRRVLGAGGALVVYKIRSAELLEEDIGERINLLLRTLLDLGARDFDFVLVCERLETFPRLKFIYPRSYVRFVERFNPENNAVSGRLGDNRGWKLLYTEFQPFEKKEQKHAFVFEKHRQ